MMATPIFALEEAGNTLIVEPQRNVTSLADDEVHCELQSILARLAEPQPHNLVVDFGKIEYFGSSMLEAMRSIAQRVHAYDGSLALCNLSPVAREILHIARFDVVWPIYNSRAEALAAVQA
jgi:anti-anti-sigma factor